MVAERMKVNYDGPALIICSVYNMIRAKGARPITPLEIHPLRSHDRRGPRPGSTKITAENLMQIGEAMQASLRR